MLDFKAIWMPQDGGFLPQTPCAPRRAQGRFSLFPSRQGSLCQESRLPGKSGKVTSCHAAGHTGLSWQGGG